MTTVSRRCFDFITIEHGKKEVYLARDASSGKTPTEQEQMLATAQRPKRPGVMPPCTCGTRLGGLIRLGRRGGDGFPAGKRSDGPAGACSKSPALSSTTRCQAESRSRAAPCRQVSISRRRAGCWRPVRRPRALPLVLPICVRRGEFGGSLPPAGRGGTNGTYLPVPEPPHG